MNHSSRTTSSIFSTFSSLVVAATFLAISGMPVTVSAQTTVGTIENYDYQLLEPLPCIPGEGVNCGSGGELQDSLEFDSYVQYVFNLLIAIAAVAAVFMIVWGGFLYVSSDSFNDKKEGREKLENAIYGLLLVLCSYLILRTIDPRLVAIPSGLVEPIELKGYDGDILSDFFRSLASDAEQNLAKNRAAIAQRESLKRDVVELKKQRDVLQTLYDNARRSNDTEAIAQLQGKLALINDQIKSVEAEVVIKSTESGILTSTTINLDRGETSNVTTNTLETIREAHNLANKSYNLAKAELEKLGNPPDKVNALNNLYWPEHGAFVLQRNSLFPRTDITLDQRINDINTMLNLALPKITDPVKKAKLQTDAKERIDRLNEIKGTPGALPSSFDYMNNSTI